MNACIIDELSSENKKCTKKNSDVKYLVPVVAKGKCDGEEAAMIFVGKNPKFKLIE